jgi:hypothetical protein
MACYFFYGTLMDAAVRAAVLGRALPADAVIAAELAGWRRVRRRGATYPVLGPDDVGAHRRGRRRRPHRGG